jgi:hypothetical protein
MNERSISNPLPSYGFITALSLELLFWLAGIHFLSILDKKFRALYSIYREKIVHGVVAGFSLRQVTYGLLSGSQANSCPLYAA